jgi:sporulation protein YhbH
MSLPWELRRRGLKDSLRHDQRVKEAIKQNLRDLISEEAIITSDGNKRVKIPLRYLDQYRFKYGQPQQGVGQGEGQPGDVIGRQPGQGDGSQPGDGEPGDQPGEHTYEVEITLEELTQMMLEDLALPWMEEKPERQVTSTTHRYTDVRRKGSLANLDKRRTLMNNLRRNAARGHPEVRNFHDDDLRFKVWDVHKETHSNAAVYMLMDCSGSMTTGKKYVAKSFFFWMVRFLRMKYQHVETVFIAHDVKAQIVPEQDFFTLSSAGGTCCSSAYQLAGEHLEQHHPARSWNTYLFHFSDGDNWPSDNAVCQKWVETLLDQCTMVGYGEIRYDSESSFYGWMNKNTSAPSSLQSVFNQIAHQRLLSVTISHKEDVYQALQKFLQPREDSHV